VCQFCCWNAHPGALQAQRFHKFALEIAIQGHARHAPHHLAKNKAIINQVVACLGSRCKECLLARQLARDQAPEGPEENLLAQVRCRNPRLVKEDVPNGGSFLALPSKFLPVPGYRGIHLHLPRLHQPVHAQARQHLGDGKEQEGRLLCDVGITPGPTSAIHNHPAILHHHQLGGSVQFLLMQLGIK